MLQNKPEILAPAGDMSSFLAALAAGADGVYVGLKHFSARMKAENFSLRDLCRMVELANANKRKVYVAFNTLLKPSDISAAGHLLAHLAREARPHALIIQDAGLVNLARQVGYEGGIFFSTLAGIASASAVKAAASLGADRVILPRELNIDELREIASLCPDGPDLEIFVHGALCWCVSGRCYWSSYLGGKSGLRGRCVQPCRRLYRQNNKSGRFFSSLDLSLDVLVRALKDIPQIKSWKIEGRKKGPHYVFNVVRAYIMLRDEGSNPRARKDAESLLNMALGRKTTRASFLPQRPASPATPDNQTASGLIIGKIHTDDKSHVFIKPRQELLPGDYLRIGYEDELWHDTLPVYRRVPKSGSLTIRTKSGKKPQPGTPVFLVDRKEPELMALISDWQTKLEGFCGKTGSDINFKPKLPYPVQHTPGKISDMLLMASLPVGKQTRSGKKYLKSIWLSPRSVREISRAVAPHLVWWLPPIIWQNEEEVWRRLIKEALRNNASSFVLNAPWQVNLFAEKKLNLIAGPFCNMANTLSLQCLYELGFSAAFVAPELDRKALLSLPAKSPIPLGLVISGWWPLGISRHEPDMRSESVFSSPKKEFAWLRKYGQNYWIYPAWPLDLTGQRKELEAAGYSFFATLEEKLPKGLPQSKRPGLFNWDGALL